MKSRKLSEFRLLLWLGVLLAMGGASVCAGASFKFSESLADQLLCPNEDEDSTCDTFNSGRFRLTVTIADEAIDPSQFDETTPFVITIGDFTFAGTLGDDPNYKAGDAKARFRLTEQACDGNTNCTKFTSGKIVVRMKKTELKVTISTRTGPDVHAEPSALATNYINDEPGTISDFLPSAASIQLGDQSASTDLAVSANVKQRMTTMYEEDFTLGDVKLSAFAE